MNTSAKSTGLQRVQEGNAFAAMSYVDTPDEDAPIEEVSNTAEFRERITRYGLDVHAETLESLVRPSIRFEIQKSTSDPLPERSTHFGGAPDLPPDYAWPQWDGAPLTFIAQFDLNEMAGLTPLPLPGTGLLSIFYEAVEQPWGYTPSDAKSCAVIWTDSNTPTSRRLHPEYPGEDGLPLNRDGTRSGLNPTR